MNSRLHLFTLCLLPTVFALTLSAGQPPQKEAPLSPEESLKKFVVPNDLEIEQVLAEPQISQPVFLNFDERGRMWVVEFRQYPTVEGVKVVSHDAVWRAVFDKIPEPPPKGVRGKDRISIHEDTDGDGKYDKHTVFVDGLNIATAVERGRGGVWVLNPPYFLFYPDKNNDDVPDGPPEVLLEGFGLEDTHATVNSLRWGPDGWLYAGQGSTVSGKVRKPGESDKETVNTLGQIIWRYHPDTRRYEVFAEGGGNTYGVELDSKGRIFSGHNGGNTRGFHFVQGGYSRKGFDKHGPLSNPYAFGFFPQMNHESKVQRFTHTFLTYEGGVLPEKYHGKLLAADPMRGAIFETEIIPEGSTFRTKDLGEAVATSDKWFRPVDVKIGPDGLVYVADWYDGQLTHLRNQEGNMDVEKGRIYRVKARGAARTLPVDLSRKSSQELVELLRSENRWTRQTALRLLGDRKDATIISALTASLENTQGQPALESLWALHASGGFSDAVALKTLNHADPFVRLWSVRLLCDDYNVSPTIAAALAESAQRESNVEARNQLACSARRLPLADAFPIVKHLLARSEDASDAQIPLLIWWAIECRCATDRDAVLEFFKDTTLWSLPLVREQILERLMRRWASVGSREELLACAKLLELSPDKDCSKRLMGGFEKAFEGRAIPALPTEFMQAMAKAGGDSLLLDLRLGKADSVSRALAVISDEKAKPGKRLPLIQVFGEINQPEGVPALLKIATRKGDVILRKAALTALQQYGDASIAQTLLGSLKDLPPDVRPVALGILITRPEWTQQLLKAVEGGALARDSVPREIIESLQHNADEAVAPAVEKLWPKSRRPADVKLDDEQRAEIARVLKIIGAGGGSPTNGMALFNQRCTACHVLFGQGGQVGPDLTVFKRDDLNTMLLSIVAPSAEIREGFENVMIKTRDGRRMNGIIKEQDKQIVVLHGADGQDSTIQRAQIETIKPGISLMPEGVLNGLSDEQLLDLFAFLRGTQPPK